VTFGPKMVTITTAHSIPTTIRTSEGFKNTENKIMCIEQMIDHSLCNPKRKICGFEFPNRPLFLTSPSCVEIELVIVNYV
jgi:hypothetical protein